MSKISVVIPTISGREEWLANCKAAYERFSPKGTEIIVIKDEPSCGHAWQKGWEKSTGDYVHFTADDLEPMASSWWNWSSQLIDRGTIPAAVVYNTQGQVAVCDSPLGDMGHPPNVLVPFLHREWLEKGDWLLPIHYGSDDWVSYMATYRRIPIRRELSYSFRHHVADEGRNYLRRHGDVVKLVVAMREKGYVPPVYVQLEKNLRTSKTGLDNVRIHQLEIEDQRQLREARGHP